eukprot:15426423-Alexandrium_andersonii.AAC.1
MAWKRRALPRCRGGQTKAPRETVAFYFLEKFHNATAWGFFKAAINNHLFQFKITESGKTWARDLRRFSSAKRQ